MKDPPYNYMKKMSPLRYSNRVTGSLDLCKYSHQVYQFVVIKLPHLRQDKIVTIINLNVNRSPPNEMSAKQALTMTYLGINGAQGTQRTCTIPNLSTVPQKYDRGKRPSGMIFAFQHS